MNFIDLIYVVILGIVEGITEWLPVSSTGHIIIVREFMNKFTSSNLSDDFFNMFDVVIQLGAIMAIVVLFFNRLNPINPKLTKEERNEKWELWLKVIVACIPAGIIGVLFNDAIEELLFNPTVIAISLIFYGVLFIVLEKFNKKRNFEIDSIKKMSYKVVVLIGLIQLLALVPGTSRSGVTILGAMLLLCNRTVAAEFSFFLSIPIMFGASFVKILDFGLPSSNELVLLLIGMITAFVVSILAVKALMAFIKKHDFASFGYYRIAIGIVVLLLFGYVF